MNTKILMISSCVFLGSLGIAFTFIPDEIISRVGISSNQISALLLQLLGALYLGFGLLNWMAKGSPIGGIYNKPIAIGNFMHFAVGAMALIKLSTKIDTHLEIVVLLTAIYVAFALLFGYVFRTNPSKVK